MPDKIKNSDGSTVPVVSVQGADFGTAPAFTVSGTANTSALGSAISGGIPNAVSVVAAATTNATVIKGSASRVFTISAWSSVDAWLKVFNKATAPVPGTDTPVMNIYVAAKVAVAISFGDVGQQFAAGVGIAITAGAPLLDATAVASAGTAGVNFSFS